MDDTKLSHAEKLKVLWKKGRNMYISLFAELEEVRKRFNTDEEFANWCFYDLGISISILYDVAAIIEPKGSWGRTGERERIRMALNLRRNWRSSPR